MNISFTCGPNPAFSASQSISATPSYSLPIGYRALYVTGRMTVQLSSGVPVGLAQGNYTYLAQYDGSPASTLSSFGITWSNK